MRVRTVTTYTQPVCIHFIIKIFSMWWSVRMKVVLLLEVNVNFVNHFYWSFFHRVNFYYYSLYMLNSDRYPVSNWCLFFKLKSTLKFGKVRFEIWQLMIPLLQKYPIKIWLLFSVTKYTSFMNYIIKLCVGMLYCDIASYWQFILISFHSVF